MLEKNENTKKSEDTPSAPMVLGYGLHLSRETAQSKKRVFEQIADLTSRVSEIELFCKKLLEFKLDYQERYHFKGAGNTYASTKLIQSLKELIFSIELDTLQEGLKEPILKEQLQSALFHFLKEFAEMDAKRTAENNNIPLESVREVEISVHYDSLENFKKYLKSQLQGSRKHLLKFRYLFPLGEEPDVPEELGQGSVKPFINRVESLFKETFQNEEKDLTKEASPKIASQSTSKKALFSFN